MVSRPSRLLEPGPGQFSLAGEAGLKSLQRHYIISTNGKSILPVIYRFFREFCPAPALPKSRRPSAFQKPLNGLPQSTSSGLKEQ